MKQAQQGINITNLAWAWHSITIASHDITSSVAEMSGYLLSINRVEGANCSFVHEYIDTNLAENLGVSQAALTKAT